jgi:hypothetical protein
VVLFRVQESTLKVSLDRQEAMLCHLSAWVMAMKNLSVGDSAKTYTKDKTLHELLAQDAEAIGSEWAVAKYFNLDFDPFEEKGKEKADVGKGIEVRWTKYAEGQLIVHEYDRSTDIAVLVTGNSSTAYNIVGWIPVAIAKRDKYRHTRQPNWWVSQPNLQPIENLVRSNYGTDAI